MDKLGNKMATGLDGYMDTWMHGCMDGWMDGWMNGEPTEEWTAQQGGRVPGDRRARRAFGRPLWRQPRCDRKMLCEPKRKMQTSGLVRPTRQAPLLAFSCAWRGPGTWDRTPVKHVFWRPGQPGKSPLILRVFLSLSLSLSLLFPLSVTVDC